MRDYALIAVGVIIGLCAPRYYREWADLLSNWRGHVRAWKVALRGGTPAEVEAAYGDPRPTDEIAEARKKRQNNAA